MEKFICTECNRIGKADEAVTTENGVLWVGFCPDCENPVEWKKEGGNK